MRTSLMCLYFIWMLQYLRDTGRAGIIDFYIGCMRTCISIYEYMQAVGPTRSSDNRRPNTTTTSGVAE